MIALNARNPQVASRMARALENWQRYTPALQALIKAEMQRVAACEALSSDVREIVEKALGA